MSDNADITKMEKPTTDTPAQPKVVVFCVSGEQFSGRFLHLWGELVLQCLMNNVRPILSQTYNRDLYTSRNLSLGANVISNSPMQKPFQEKLEYDYLIWLDPSVDITFADVKKLMDSPHPITTGIFTYGFSNHQATNVVRQFNMEQYRKSGGFAFLNYDGVVNMEKEDNRYFEVEFANFGLMCVQKGVMEKLTYPWFEPYTERIVEVKKEGESEANGDVQDASVAFYTDAYCFCNKMRDAGLRIMVDSNIKQKSVD